MKEYLKHFLAGCLLMTAVFFLFSAQNCEAAGLEQTGAAKHSVTVRWDLKEDALRYLIYVGTCNADSRLYAKADASVMTMKIRGLAAGSSSYIRADYEYMDKDGRIKTKLAGYTASAKTLPDAVQNVRQTSWYDRAESCSVSWDRMDCADGYEYIVRNRNGRKIAAGKVKGGGTSARINRIAAQEICTIQVRACVTVGGEEICGDWSEPCFLFAQPHIRKLFVSGGGLRVQWRRIKGASGYDVYVFRKGSGGFVKAKSVGESENSVLLLQAGGEKISEENIYYVYVTAKKKTGKQILNGGRYFYKNTKNDDTGYF